MNSLTETRLGTISAAMEVDNVQVQALKNEQDVDQGKKCPKKEELMNTLKVMYQYSLSFALGGTMISLFIFLHSMEIFCHFSLLLVRYLVFSLLAPH